MFFVVEKLRLQRIISIIREDKDRSKQGSQSPFLRLEATDSRLAISSSQVSGTFPATVYETGVLFIRTTRFRKLLRSIRGEKYLTFQVSYDGLLFDNIMMPFKDSDMVLYTNPDDAPESWPLLPAEAEEVPEKKEPTLFDIDSEKTQEN